MLNNLLYILIATLVVFAIFGGRIGRKLTLVVLAIIGVATIFALLYALSTFLTAQTLENSFLKISDALGVSPLFAKGAALLLLLPAGTAVAWSVSRDARKRTAGRYALALSASAYFMGLALVTSDMKVSSTGEALQCFIVTERGVVWKDVKFQGTDPQTGRECSAASASLIPTLEKLDQLLRSGGSLEPVDPKGKYFNALGEPIVWYIEGEDGVPSYYPHPGNDPKTGIKLLPMTREKIAPFEAALANQLAKAAREAELAQKQEAEQKAVAAKEARARDLSEYVLNTTQGASTRRIGLAFWSDDKSTELASRALLEVKAQLENAIGQKGLTAANTFKESFYSSAFFQELADDDNQVLVESGVLGFVSAMIVASVGKSCAGAQSMAGLVSCEIYVNYRIVGPSGETLSRGRLREKASGGSRDAAIARAAELLANRHMQTLIEGLN